MEYILDCVQAKEQVQAMSAIMAASTTDSPFIGRIDPSIAHTSSHTMKSATRATTMPAALVMTSAERAPTPTSVM